MAHTNRVPEEIEECTIFHDLVMNCVMIDQFLNIPGLDVDHRDAQGRTLLHAACRGYCGLDYVLDSQYSSGTKKDERVTILQHLLSLGADIRARDNLGRNMLHHIIGNASRPSKPVNYEVPLPPSRLWLQISSTSPIQTARRHCTTRPHAPPSDARPKPRRRSSPPGQIPAPWITRATRRCTSSRITSAPRTYDLSFRISWSGVQTSTRATSAARRLYFRSPLGQDTAGSRVTHPTLAG